MLEKFLKAWCSHSFKSLLWVSICALSYGEQVRQDEADQEQSYLLSWDCGEDMESGKWDTIISRLCGDSMRGTMGFP